MKTHWSVLILGVLVLTTACTGHGEKAAQQWLERQLASKQEILDLPRIPEVSDTLPVAYNPELYPDPFKKIWPVQARVKYHKTWRATLGRAFREMT